MNNSGRLIVVLVLVSYGCVAAAHHSTAGFYDPESIVEIDGVVKSVSMRNPHIHFVVTVASSDGEKVDWNLESVSLSALQINGLDQDFMKPGDRLRVAGQESRRGRPEMNASNVLLEDGSEVVLLLRGEPYFTSDGGDDLLRPVFDKSVEEAARRSADGIFRVWSSVVSDPESFPILKGDYPLTEAAEQARANWDPEGSDLLGCYEKGMPQLMETPLPVELVRMGNDILMRFQEGEGAERLIHMNDDAVPPEIRLFRGYSTGRWEGDTLVVQTSRISATNFDGGGVVQSRDISLVERFSLSANEERLDYLLTITDPATFTRTFDLTKYWVWRPEIAIHAWNCDLSTVPE